jgi:hypothetical protein
MGRMNDPASLARNEEEMVACESMALSNPAWLRPMANGKIHQPDRYRPRSIYHFAEGDVLRLVPYVGWNIRRLGVPKP